MNDGVDADSLYTTIEYLMNESSQLDNGICPIEGGPIDLGLPYQRTGNDLRIDGYDPEIRDSDESSDEDNAIAVTRQIKQACGNFSNAFIEERWKERCSEESPKSGAPKVQLKKSYDLLRESAHAMSLQRNRQNPISVEAPREEPKPENKEVPETNQRQNSKSKKKRHKFKNAAIQSLLGINNTSIVQPAEQVTAGTEPASSSTTATVSSTTAAVSSTPAALSSTTAAVSSTTAAVLSTTANTIVNGRKPPGRGRGRLSDSSRRNNISMIRQECIHGYDADPDYDPNKPLVNNCLPSYDRDEFPPL